MTLAWVDGGEVVRVGPPRVGVLADGRAVSGYDRLPEDVLRAEGWLPVEEVDPPAHNAVVEQAVLDGYDVLGDRVRARWRVEPLPPDPIGSLPGEHHYVDPNWGA